jgi:hypothetical protein
MIYRFLAVIGSAAALAACSSEDAVRYEPVSPCIFGKCREILPKCRETVSVCRPKAIRSQQAG